MAISATIASRLTTDEYDVDFIAQLDLPRAVAPRTAIDLLLHTIRGEPDSLYHDMAERRTRCVTVHYADKMHADITPMICLPEREERTSLLFHLRRDTTRYAFRNRIAVVDLGLRLEDVKDSGLETEEVVHRSDPAPNLRENGATAEEIAFLRTRRVELNAFASADFIAWIERKLEQHGVTKIVPDENALTMAWRRSVAARYVTSRLQGAVQDARRYAAEEPVPDDLATLVAAGLRDDPTQSWDEVVQRLAATRVGPERG